MSQVLDLAEQHRATILFSKALSIQTALRRRLACDIFSQKKSERVEYFREKAARLAFLNRYVYVYMYMYMYMYYISHIYV